MANIIAMAAAHTNSFFVAAADRIGTERGQPFIGQSLIVSYTGWPIGGPATPTKKRSCLRRSTFQKRAKSGAGMITIRSSATGDPTNTTTSS